MDMLYIEQDTVAGRQVAAAESVCVCVCVGEYCSCCDLQLVFVFTTLV